MTLRPLGKVKEIVEAAGMGISYAYEDLVFLEHNSFLLQFGEKGMDVLVHVNSEAESETVDGNIERMRKIARQHDISFSKGALYTLTPEDDETISLEFHE